MEPLEARQLLSIGAFLQGTAFIDSNGSGALENGDAYLPGATVSLCQGANVSGTPLATASTNANGQYLFSDSNVTTS